MKTAELISQYALALIIIFVIVISFQHEIDNAMFPPEKIKDTVIIKQAVIKEGYTDADAQYYSVKLIEFKNKNIDATNKYKATGNTFYYHLANSYMDSIKEYHRKKLWEIK